MKKVLDANAILVQSLEQKVSYVTEAVKCPPCLVDDRSSVAREGSLLFRKHKLCVRNCRRSDEANSRSFCFCVGLCAVELQTVVAAKRARVNAVFGNTVARGCASRISSFAG